MRLIALQKSPIAVFTPASNADRPITNLMNGAWELSVSNDRVVFLNTVGISSPGASEQFSLNALSFPNVTVPYP
jgi:hypothetical protein